MSKFSWEYKITLLCGLCSLILFVLLGLEWLYGSSYRTEIIHNIFNAPKASFEMQAAPTYPFPQMPIEYYTDFIERPVYFEKRRPIAKIEEPNNAVVTPPKPKGEFGLILTGIIKTPKGIKALFQDPSTASGKDKNKRLAQGEEFNGWKLIDIQNDKVSIQAEGEIKEVMLLKAKPKAPTITAGSINPFAPPKVGTPAANTTPPPNHPYPNINPFNLKH